jgi:DNA modification methylase
VDSVVCDPPYHLTSIVKRFGAENTAPAKVGKTGAFARASKGFMGQTWDGGDVAFREETWAEVLRVLKPGGHLVAFSGTRTYHRMVVAIEDAGFEVRDQLAWLYGSGFPKSHDVSKQIDKLAPRAGMFDKFAAHYGARRKATGLSHNAICEAGKFYAEHNHGGASSNWEKGCNVPTLAQWAILKPLLGLSDEWLSLIEREEAGRAKVGERNASLLAVAPGQDNDRSATTLDITAPATDAAREWEGWGTALKPAWEPICLARRPLIGTVAKNVLAHGTGAINVDGCRIEANDGVPQFDKSNKRPGNTFDVGSNRTGEVSTLGRWPANIIHDGSDEVVEGFPAEAGKSSGGRIGNAGGGNVENIPTGQFEAGDPGFGDSGSAARFFAQCQYGEEEWEFVKNGLAAKSAESLCDLCGTPTAGDPAATLTLDSNSAASQAGLGSIGICGNCIPRLSRALSADSRESTDTIQIIPTCSKSNGSATPATVSTIKADGRARAEAASAPASATRFLYCPKATSAERGEGNNHPTVKPVALMRWLTRLVTPKGGIVLDPFMGSGSTALACDAEQFNFIGCELSPEYAEIARNRIAAAGGMFADISIEHAPDVRAA